MHVIATRIAGGADVKGDNPSGQTPSGRLSKREIALVLAQSWRCGKKCEVVRSTRVFPSRCRTRSWLKVVMSLTACRLKQVVTPPLKNAVVEMSETVEAEPLRDLARGEGCVPL